MSYSEVRSLQVFPWTSVLHSVSLFLLIVFMAPETNKDHYNMTPLPCSPGLSPHDILHITQNPNHTKKPYMSKQTHSPSTRSTQAQMLHIKPTSPVLKILHTSQIYTTLRPSINEECSVSYPSSIWRLFALLLAAFFPSPERYQR